MDAVMNTYGDAFAAFTYTDFDYKGTTYLVCNTTVSPNVLQYNWESINFFVDVAVSTNGGASWGAPHSAAFYNWTLADLAAIGIRTTRSSTPSTSRSARHRPRRST